MLFTDSDRLHENYIQLIVYILCGLLELAKKPRKFWTLNTNLFLYFFFLILNSSFNFILANILIISSQNISDNSNSNSNNSGSNFNNNLILNPNIEGRENCLKINEIHNGTNSLNNINNNTSDISLWLYFPEGN